jgi:hypothetical protein
VLIRRRTYDSETRKADRFVACSGHFRHEKGAAAIPAPDAGNQIPLVSSQLPGRYAKMNGIRWLNDFGLFRVNGTGRPYLLSSPNF